MQVKIKRLREDAVIPQVATLGAACADVVASVITVSEKYVTVRLGFATEIPKGYKGVIVPRSSFTQKGWVMQNSPAQIDSDYRGEWMIKFEAIPQKVGILHNLIYPEFPYKEGDRVGQMFIEKEIKFDFVLAEELSETDRASGGFGSTGN